MQNPDNLRVSAVAEELAEIVFDFVGDFPRDQRFILSAQMQRAAISVGSNIFEGCGRQNNKSLIAFLYIAHGSAAELVFQNRVAKRRNFGDPKRAAVLDRKLVQIRRMLANLIRKLESKSRPIGT